MSALFPRPPWRRQEPQCPPAPGLQLGVAQQAQQVVDAWRLVYVYYRYNNLINPNPHRIHLAPAAIDPHTAVVVGSINQLIVTTLTALIDHPVDPQRTHTADGLPLDQVYHEQLESMRRSGRRLMELGLFADRRLRLARTAETLFQLTRFAFHYALQQRVTDILIGVAERNAGFYARWFGFEPCSDPRSYPAIRNARIVLLRCDMTNVQRAGAPHPALMLFRENPVPAEVFDRRFDFAPSALAGTPIEALLADLNTQRSLSATG